MYRKALIISLLLILAGILSFISTSDERARANQMNEQYPLITKNSYVHGIIVNKIDERLSAFNKGAMFLELNNHKQFCLFETTQNKSYRESNLDEFINIGDSINKRSAKNDIYIYRDGKEYHFVLGETIE